MKKLLVLVFIVLACFDVRAGNPRSKVLFKPSIRVPEDFVIRHVPKVGTYVCRVNPSGNVVSVEVGTSSGYAALDKIAQRQLKKMKLAPGGPAVVRVPIWWNQMLD